ncbi:MAG: bifunctional ornithine acetyltransferase/N-acetylglutamate synthase, partial [Spirochaetia bacterium]|nr:bifunctional ornithine acetyltransferase/N-acetylglutamate synthase [Spirochaetia bacterium]
LGGKHSKESLVRKEWEPMEFSRGILTTDTREKRIACEVQLGGTKKFRFSACAKGAGMIHPNMATMLAFITTDLKLNQAQCQKVLSQSILGTFNQVTVDGDTSTNDSAFLLASGASGVKIGDGATMDEVQEIVDTMTAYLAKEVARDGEGATKLITVTASGAANLLEARQAARTVASSLLFKTAVFGGDPNYGRILVALGNAGLGLRPEKTEVSFAKIPLFQKNKVQEKNIPKAAAYLKDNKHIEVNVDLGRGTHSASAWTCDISYDYVKINGEYTT